MIRELPATDPSSDQESFTAVCQATGTWTLTDQLLGKFQRLAPLLADHAMPAPEQTSLETWVDDNGDTNEAIPPTMMEEDVSEFRNEAWTSLLTVVRRAVQMFRWRVGLAGRHNPIRIREVGNSWSFDGETWFPLAIMVMDTSNKTARASVPEGYARDVEQLLRSNADEPLAHQLYREAWNQRKENPRCALVIGVAAAEIGVASFISDRVPAAA